MERERPKRQKSISYVPFGNRKYSINESSEFLPPVFDNGVPNNEEFQLLETQVAGHQFNFEKNTIGLLKCKDGTVLKPVTKKETGLREINFYEKLQNTTDVTLLELKELCPQFSGTRMLDVHGNKVEFIILDNISDGMIEPCIIDIKIGKVTWDPTATDEKIAKEKEKYSQCKNDVGFCIPGFQVYKLSTDRLHKYNKDYGKKLNGKTVLDALRIFLNADGNHILCRELIVKLLSSLWEIQTWARKQKSLRLYSTSLLMAYDCKKLRSIMDQKNSEQFHPVVRPPLVRKISFNSAEGSVKVITTNYSGKVALTSSVPSTPTTSSTFQKFTSLNNSYSVTENGPFWQKDFRKISRSHSFHHNYNDYLSKIKKDYHSTLQELINDKPNRPWFNVKIIDFAHIFPAEEFTQDTNYLEGIDNLVKIFEDFLDIAK